MKRKAKQKTRKGNKWQSILNRCFSRNPSENQKEWLHKFNKELKEKKSLSKRQIIVLVRIARSLKAYYEDRQPSSEQLLNRKLKKMQHDRENQARARQEAKPAPVILRKMAK